MAFHMVFNSIVECIIEKTKRLPKSESMQDKRWLRMHLAYISIVATKTPKVQTQTHGAREAQASSEGSWPKLRLRYFVGTL